MEKFWREALKVTGPVAVVGFLLWALLNFIFREEVVAMFGSEKLFLIVIVLVSILAISLITSILVYKMKIPRKETKPPKIFGNRTTINRSTIKGDVVSGDKYVNTKDKDE